MTNNGIEGNCSSPAWQKGAEKRTVAVELSKAGYRTGFFGKYLNQYGRADAGGPEHVPPGWDRWYGLVGNSIYYNFSLSDDGVEVKHGDTYEADYLTKLVHEQSKAFIRGDAGRGDERRPWGKPFFAWVAPPAAHDPTMPAPQHAAELEGVGAPRVPSYGASPDGKHWIMRFKPQDMSEGTDAQVYGDNLFRRRLLTLLSVDEMIADLVAEIEAMGELENTYIVFASDNGYHIGTYSALKDKRQPYETDIRVPAYVRGPGIDADAANTMDKPVLNIDFAPTFLDMAGVELPPDMDGASFLPLIAKRGASGRGDADSVRRGSDAGGDTWRTDFLLEFHGESWRPSVKEWGTCGQKSLACTWVGQEQYSVEPKYSGQPLCSCQDSHNNTYRCVRDVGGAEERARARERSAALAAQGSDEVANSGFVYCAWDDGEEEYYDLRNDPWQLRNSVGDLSGPTLAKLRARLAELSGCRAESCRSARRRRGRPHRGN